MEKCSTNKLTSINFDAWLVICGRSHVMMLFYYIAPNMN